MTAPLLSADGLFKTFVAGTRRVAVLRDVSLDVFRGETVGLVGPSGSGKSTLARVLLRLIEPDAGRLALDGADLRALKGRELRRIRRRIQMVFQDPLAAFNPRATVGGALADPLRIHGIAPRREWPLAVARLLDSVGLSARLAGRAFHEISGGQRQRVAIARALATQPDLIVFDEAASALDASIRGQILELLVSLQRERGIAYLFISHDIAVVRVIAHRIAVMEAGVVVEVGATQDVVAAPKAEVTRQLVAAVPRLAHAPAR